MMCMLILFMQRPALSMRQGAVGFYGYQDVSAKAEERICSVLDCRCEGKGEMRRDAGSSRFQVFAPGKAMKEILFFRLLLPGKTKEGWGVTAFRD